MIRQVMAYTAARWLVSRWLAAGTGDVHRRLQAEAAKSDPRKRVAAATAPRIGPDAPSACGHLLYDSSVVVLCICHPATYAVAACADHIATRRQLLLTLWGGAVPLPVSKLLVPIERFQLVTFPLNQYNDG